MAKNLVIVESPAKARTIEKFLGKEYKVMSSIGHIRDLPEKKMGIDIKNNFKPDYIISPDKKKVVSELKKETKNANKIYIATDEDREGEAIGWHLLHALDIKKDKDYERIVFHEITKKAILESIENPRKIDERLVNAQQARRLLDRLVGYELSPILWSKVRQGLSAGRVQSVALRIIVEREEEIRAFKPEEFWKIKTLVSKNKTDWEMVCTTNLKNKEIKNETEFKKIFDEIEGKNLIISEIDSKETKRAAPAPLTTSSLQQAASTELGFSVKQTMTLAQRLYEGVDMGSEREGLITYMRTDSLNLSSEALLGAKKAIEKNLGKEYALSSPRVFKTKSKGAQEAHEAIRPVDFSKTPESMEKHLDKNEFRLYELIYNRTLQTQMQEAVVATTKIEANPKGTNYIFEAKGERVIFDGWMKLGKPKKEIIFPELKQKEELKTGEYNGEQNFTKPPARYSEASLVKELEKKGIGRPSTYAPTISTIIDRGYVEKKNPETGEVWKYLVPTEIGILVTNFLKEHFMDVVDYDFTANIEEDLDDIAEGKKVWEKVLDGIYKPFHKNIEDKKEHVAKVVEKTGHKCPKCGASEIYKFGRFGKFRTCENYPECDYTAPLEEEIKEKEALEAKFKGEKCDKCGKEMVVKKGRFGSFLGCSGYPECKNIKPIVESTGIKCPLCKKGELVGKNTRKGKQFFGCSTYPTCKFATWTKPTDENIEELLEKYLNKEEREETSSKPSKKTTRKKK